MLIHHSFDHSHVVCTAGTVMLANESNLLQCQTVRQSAAASCAVSPVRLRWWLGRGVITAITPSWLRFLSSARATTWRLQGYMRDHDPVWWGNRPSERDYYSYYNTVKESTLKQMLGALCRAFGTEPNPTYLHSYLHGNPAAQPLSFFFFSVFLSPLSLAFAFSLRSCLYIYIPPSYVSLLLSPDCLKSNTYSRKLWSIKHTNLFSWGDSDILMQIQLHRHEKGQASRISEYLSADANLYPTLYI